MNELPDDIERSLKRLDRDAERASRAVDAGRVADAVLKRLREEPVRVIRPRPWLPVGMRIAAAVALLVVGGVVAQRLLRGPAAVEMAVLPGFDSLPVDSSQHTALLQAVDDARAAARGTLPVTSVLIEELNEQELETLLTTMEREGAL